MLTLNKSTLSIIILGLISTFASAESKNIYVGIGFGQSYLDPSYTDRSPGPGDDDFAWQLNIGHNFNDYLAAEISYADLGDFTLDDRKAGYKVYSAHALAYLPLNNSKTFSVYGKLGVSHISIDNDDGLLVDLGTAEGFTGGVGIRWKFTESWSARAEYNMYNEDIQTAMLNFDHAW